MPSSPSFSDRLRRAQEESSSLLCIGLDPDPARLPAPLSGKEDPTDSVRRFCLEVLESTQEFACAYKVNFAFFEALDTRGWEVLRQVVSAIPDSKIKIADAKRGDIGNTGRFYAEAILDRGGFDACTVSPYMGRTSVEPFLKYRGKAAFVLARTSNPHADEIQDWPRSSEPLYRHVARTAVGWAAGEPGEVGLVVGATDPSAITLLRRDCPTLPFLVPGVGAQGGDLESVLTAGLTGRGNLLIASSRSILYSGHDIDYAAAAGEAARSLRDTINGLRAGR